MLSVARARTAVVARLCAGTLLLLPALLAFGLTLGYPALRTLALSLQSAAPGRAGHWAGLANYAGLTADPTFARALAHSLLVALVRVAALLLPAALAGLWRGERRSTRLLVHLALGVPLALSAPVALALVWVLAGRRVPGLERLTLEGGRPLASSLGLELLAFLGLGGALAATALLLARPGRARRGVLGLAALLAAASGLDSFTLPFTATGGTPLTLPLHAFRSAFLGLQLGPAAAQASIQTALSLGLGLAFARLGERLRLRPAGADEPHALCGERPLRALAPIVRRALGAAALALFLLPFLLAYLWSAGLAGHPSGQPLARALDELLPGLSLINGIPLPVMTTLLYGLPAAYLAALSLSLVRPFGRRGSRAAYLALLAAGFVPPVASAIGLYDGVRAVGLYNNPAGAVLPFLANPAALCILKLYFDGQAPLLEKVRRAGQPVATAFVELALRPSLGVAALAGAVSLLLAGQSLLWPLLVLAQRDFFPLSLRLAVLQGALAGEPAALGAGCWLLLTVWGAATLLAWWPLQVWLAGRFEIAVAE
jgi:ABC-type sugar transport system permease subunit/ABC-type glycerol-3-phosphate transport system permease component